VLAAVLVTLAGAYAVVVCAFAAGATSLRRAARLETPLPDDRLPRAAVIVAARNEEHRLPRCLDALLAQDYPVDHLTVVVVDDHSSDGTAAVVERFLRRAEVRMPAPASVSAGSPVASALAGDDRPASGAVPRVVGIQAPGGGTLRGKAAAVHAGILAADDFEAEVILFTDADCAPPPGWCRALASRLTEPGVGIACGRTEVDATAIGRSRMAEAEALDWIYLLTAAAVLTERVAPATGMGNNMGLRREAYDEVGGFHGVRHSVTEDHALFHAVTTRTRWRPRFPLDPALAVQTLPLGRLGEVYVQRRRWARGGLVAGPVLFGLYSLIHLAHLALIVAAGLAVAGLFPPAAFVAMLAAKFGADCLLFRAALPDDRRWLLRSTLAAEGLILLYFSTLPLSLVLAPVIRWKGRRH